MPPISHEDAQIAAATLAQYVTEQTRPPAPAPEPPAPPPAPEPPAPPPAPSAPAAGTILALQWNPFTLPAATRVRYGANDRWYAMDLPAGTHEAKDPAPFEDPNYGVAKVAISMGPATGEPAGMLTIAPPLPPTSPPPTSPPPTSPPPTSPPPAPVPPGADAITDASGGVVPTAYVAMAGKMHLAEGLAYRYGAPSTLPNTGLPTYFKPNDTPMPVDQQQGGVAGGRPVSKAYAGTYQVGTWISQVGGFSSNWGHVGFLADQMGVHAGVADLLLTSISNAVLTEKPELPWMQWGGGLNSKNLAGAGLSGLVCMDRSHGRPGWGVSSIAVFADGRIVNIGSNTQSNKASTQLPANKKPTAIALSNSNEFAFITVWDTQALRGEIAVVALCSLADKGTLANPDSHPGHVGDSWGNWGEWREPYPGLPNLGNFVFMKILGYVPLPDSMKAPTEISMTTGMDRLAYLSAGGSETESPSQVTLSVEANRQKFNTTAPFNKSIPTEGWAVVISKSERKVAFVDCTPLLQFYKSMYFGPRSNFDQTRSVGQGSAQWPYPFAFASAQIPRVVTVRDLDQRPTSVRCYAWGSNRNVYIGTEDGSVRIFDVASQNQIGSVAVGKNPTAIQFVKEKAGKEFGVYPDITREVIVTSRGDRKVQWVRFDGGMGSIVRTLQDTRIVDPIVACDTDNQGSEMYVVDIVDFAGKKVHGVRFAPVNLWSNWPTYQVGGGQGFEYGGAFDMPGKPFQLCSSNTS